ncbi:MAG: creatininase family protein [Armatimonadetes bacterium]|nr:creatininase family protein [Armatimonadota bacterium]
MEYADLSWPQAEALLSSPRKPVLLFPVGATEPHGPHAPLATDMVISLGMCRRAAAALADDPEMGALILPPLAYGVTRYSAKFPGSVHISEETLHNTVVGICASLIAQGFRYVLLVNNHFEPEHVQTLHRSIDTVQARTGVTVGYLDLTRRERAALLGEEFRRAECHAGRYETSLVLAEKPETVDRHTMATLPAVPVSLVTAIGQGLKEFKAMGLPQAYNGAPAEASAAEGEETFAVLTQMLIETMRALVRGMGGRDRPGFFGRREDGP